MKIKTAVFTIIALLIIAAGIVLGFSSVDSRLQCGGQITSGDESKATTIYIKLEEYRWWVGLWGASDGNLNLEIPNTVLEYYPHIDEVGDQLQIYINQSEFRGNFSKLSKVLALKTPVGFFDGECKYLK